MTTRRAATTELSDIPKIITKSPDSFRADTAAPEKRFHDFLRTPPDVPDKRPRPRLKGETPDDLTDRCPVQSFGKTRPAAQGDQVIRARNAPDEARTTATPHHVPPQRFALRTYTQQPTPTSPVAYTYAEQSAQGSGVRQGGDRAGATEHRRR
jgi:hypothetical protein